MSCNQIKIVSNTKRHSIAFYMKSEVGKWNLVSNDSSLSRKEYTDATIQSRAKDIVQVINSLYNQGNRGVNIFFEGEKKDFLLLKEIVDGQFSKSGITCALQKSHIAVAGKTGSGKTSLIRGFGIYRGISFNSRQKDGVNIFTDDEETVVWYEIPAIDFGAENLPKARDVLEKLARSGLTTFIYCLGTNKIKVSEEEFIFFVRDNYPEIKVLVVLTQSVNDEQALYIDQLSEILKGIKVIPILAMDMNTRMGVVSAFGLDDVDRYLSEGK